MWLYIFHLGFIEATVLQKRNPHNYMKDFLPEITMYETSASIIEIVENAISSQKSIEGNLYNTYESLLKKSC